ncbi:polymer-forming cytoskeletal protein [Shewanella avicenniae]|uniref:Polymer-forming cytoskeletal protein n=1 Tax=Shewanella avicenniae TaxID=2814294 RepID=A0ABX7QMA2_9GAMM|nr:polymer-forming cytoskeletal protein [Shewanella avicenniae]QSX32581.1 polymer-forming cytoskeletal protein [Shewanella avicenniae]
MFGSKPKKSEITYIAKGTSVTGTMYFDGDTLVSGSLQGDIHADCGISIEPNGIIDGQLRCVELKVSGVFRGKVSCEKLIITESGTVEGEVFSTSMEIFEGGQFIGVRVKEQVNLLDEVPSLLKNATPTQKLSFETD